MVLKKALIFYGFLLLPCSYVAAFSFKKITVLTHPIGLSGSEGHPGVTRSLRAGLERLKVEHNINPGSISEVGDIVIVLANIEALRQAIMLKRRGFIKRLLAGPNLMVLSNEHDHIAASPEIDLYIVNSLWTKIAYIEDEPSLASHIVIHAAGVDEAYWKPTLLCGERTGNDVLLYIKQTPEILYQEVETILKRYGWNPIHLVYGSYTHHQFKQLLNTCRFAVFVGVAESQSLALLEAWAMDVPTFPYDSRKKTYGGKTFSLVTSCPYLSRESGIDWRTPAELEAIIKGVHHILDEFMPRAWVLNNLTDELSAYKMLTLVESTFV